MAKTKKTLHKQDKRSKRIVFVSNCLLNANNKVFEFARYSGMFSDVVKILDKYGFGVMQMPCPEVLHMGNQRWWTSRNLYDNAGYRRLCRQLAAQTADYIANYYKVGYEVTAILTCDGSPSCGITKSSFCEDWGGRPKEVPRVLVDKPGIFMEELLGELADRGLEAPPVYGLMMDDREKSTDDILQEFDDYIRHRTDAFGKIQTNAKNKI